LTECAGVVRAVLDGRERRASVVAEPVAEHRPRPPTDAADESLACGGVAWIEAVGRTGPGVATVDLATPQAAEGWGPHAVGGEVGAGLQGVVEFEELNAGDFVARHSVLVRNTATARD